MSQRQGEQRGQRCSRFTTCLSGATETLTHKSARPSVTAHTPAGKRSKKNTHANARKKTGSDESDNDSSELSDAEEVEEDEATESSDEAMSPSGPSESEADVDRTSDYEESGRRKRKRATKPAQPKVAPAKKLRRGQAGAQRAAAKVNAGARRARPKVKQMGSKEKLPIREDNKLFSECKGEDKRGPS